MLTFLSGAAWTKGERISDVALAAAAADVDMVALDLVIAAGVDLGSQQADIADVVLCAGIRAAGEVDVEGYIDVEAGIEMVGQRQPVPLRVGEREATTGIAGAGDEAGAQRIGARSKSGGGDGGDRVFELGVGNS